MNSTLYAASGFGFIALTVIMYWVVIRELKKGISLTAWDEARKQRISNKFIFAILGWTAFILGVSATGFFENFSAFPPRIMIVLGIPLVTIILVVFSKPVKELLTHIPARSLIRLQVFRVFVELLLWATFIANVLPIQMTFEGRNFDILAGLFAAPVAYYFANNRTVLYLYNFISLGLLLNIIIIAILSLPTPFRVFMNEPANVLVARFPFVLLPGMLVPLAYGLHFLSLRQLGLAKRQG